MTPCLMEGSIIVELAIAHRIIYADSMLRALSIIRLWRVLNVRLIKPPKRNPKCRTIREP